ncbi:MAG: response regulator transcription factor [Bacteroidota bacterium]
MASNLNSVRALVVDDNPSFIDLIQLFLEELEIKKIFAASTYQEAVQILENQKFDFILLDINLGKGAYTGIDFAYEVRKHLPDIPIIFLTSYFNEETYEKARPTRPSTFLNKELSKLKLLQAIELALIHANNRNSLANTTTNQFNTMGSRFFFKIGDSFKGIDIKDIAYFYADNKMTYAQVSDRSYPTEVMLKVLEQRLYPDFARIHKGYLVNTNLIEQINFREYVVNISGNTLPIGHHYKKALASQLNILR